MSDSSASSSSIPFNRFGLALGLGEKLENPSQEAYNKYKQGLLDMGKTIHKTILTTLEVQKQFGLKIATFNIDQAKIEEKVTDQDVRDGKFDTRWDHRCGMVVKLINECGADIICLQELKNLTTSKYDIKTFLALLNYDHEYTYYGEHERDFALAILYKRSVVTPIKHDLFHYDDDPNSSFACYGIKFKYRGYNRAFWVYNTHLSFDEARKDTSVKILVNKFHNFTEPMILCGDFNFFEDKDGGRQRADLTAIMKDMAHPLFLNDTMYKLNEEAPPPLNGTFYGYEGDEHKKTRATMSRLDHMFTRHMFFVHSAFAYGVTEELIKSRAYPSDHVMIVVSVLPEVCEMVWN